MAYKTRSSRHLVRRARRKLLSSIIIILFLLFATFHWILPNLIGGVGVVKNVLTPVKQTDNPTTISETLAPPVLFVPFEATNSAKIDIKGYATAGSKVKIYLEDVLVDTASVGADGNLVSKNVPLALGRNNIYGKTIDDKGTESLPSKTIVVVYDNEKPALTLTDPTDGKIITGGDKKVLVAGKTDPDIPVIVNDSRVITASDGKFSTTLNINEGDNQITIRAVDKAANSTEITRSVTYKTQ